MLEVSNLNISTASGRELVKEISFAIQKGERVGLIGESGSGKSLTALSIMGLLDPNLRADGSVLFEGSELLGASEKELARLRGKKISMVFQEPMTALDPLVPVGKQVAEALEIHGGASKSNVQARVLELFEDVQLPDPQKTLKRYPHQLSGGQRQRVLIAMALANDPDLLLCDEPTTALDATVQAQIVELILKLAAKHETALLFITHDLALVSEVCERLLVMRNGEIVESGPLSAVLSAPQHEYTSGLMAASDIRARNREGRLYTVATAADGSYQPGVALARPTRPQQGEIVASGSGLGKVYESGTWFRKHQTVALEDVSFELREAGRLGIVGGSGSGKSTLLRIIAGLDKPNAGSCQVEGSTAMVFQDPMSSLDPRMTIAQIVAEPLHRLQRSEQQLRVRQVLEDVGIPTSALSRYPHEFSGGQRQRISIARALSSRPNILLADEPVSALDVSVRATVLNLLEDLANSYGLSMIFVSHDLSVVRELCTDVLVMSHGRVVETGTVQEIYHNPTHADTIKLLSAVPQLVTAKL